jgi:urease accessory protein
METSFKVIDGNEKNKKLIDNISLSYEDRFIRRKKLVTDNGTEFLVNLKETISVDENHFFELENGKVIKIISKEENLIEIKGKNLKQIIWHIGNRHLPCQIEEARILIQEDPVILDMILKLKGNVNKVFEKFKPEGGAYGLGRTHSHKH